MFAKLTETGKIVTCITLLDVNVNGFFYYKHEEDLEIKSSQKDVIGFVGFFFGGGSFKPTSQVYKSFLRKWYLFLIGIHAASNVLNISV